MILICRLTYTPVSALWASPRNNCPSAEPPSPTKVEPEYEQTSVRQGPRPENHLHDSYRRFYQHTGDWLYTSGIPAKTGVGGGVMGVMPGVMGISAFAPPLDDAGNSVKAQLAIKYIMNKLGMNVFNGHRIHVQ